MLFIIITISRSSSRSWNWAGSDDGTGIAAGGGGCCCWSPVAAAAVAVDDVVVVLCPEWTRTRDRCCS